MQFKIKFNMVKNTSYFVFGLMLVCVQAGYAQIGKGNFMTGGSIRFSKTETTANYQFFPGNQPTSIAQTSHSFSFGPEVSYFVIDRFAVGLLFPYSLAKNVFSSGGITDRSTTTSFSLGPK